MRRVLLLLCVCACTAPAEDRAETDVGIGHAETAAYTFDAPDGLLHVKSASDEKLVLRASCDELAFFLTRKTRGLETLVVEVENVSPAFALNGPVSKAEAAGPLRAVFLVTFPDGVDRVELTAAPAAASNFSFLAFGDIQDGIDSFSDVVAKLNEHPDADFILFLGDFTQRSTQDEFDAIDAQLANVKLPVFATPGNHDVMDNRAYQRRYGRTSYTCTHKGARFTAIDSSSSTLATSLLPRYEGWLEQGREQLHVVFSHIPVTEILGVRAGQWSSRDEARRFTAGSVEAGVDLMLFGHIHSFDAYEVGGIPAYISGGGGAIPERFDGIDRHFLKVRVIEGKAEIEIVRVDL